MQSSNTSLTATKMIIAAILLFAAAIIIAFLYLITSSLIVSLVILLICMYMLLRAIGTFAMYPGSSFYTQAEIQMKASQQIVKRFNAFVEVFIWLYGKLKNQSVEGEQWEGNIARGVRSHLYSMVEMLALFQEKISHRKKQILRNYRRIQELIDQKSEGNCCIFDIIEDPRLIPSIGSANTDFLLQKNNQIVGNLQQIKNIITTYLPPTSTLSNLKYQIFDEKLYEIRFSFLNWRDQFQYEINEIETHDGYFLQSAVIHRRKNKEHINSRNQCVMFCNPNGVFIQHFGADNLYIKNYLDMGFSVILWNYRGYAQSTGTPSISLSQKDALSVYQHYHQKSMVIPIVHGYSIGGTSACGLAQALQYQYEENPLKLTIIDRSFSSISQMAGLFGKTLENLSKIVFFRDNIDISKIFEGLNCKKLIIWDHNDEVIPDLASVKHGILHRHYFSNKSSNLSSKDQSDQEILTLSSDVKRIALQQIDEATPANLSQVALVVKQLQFCIQAVTKAIAKNRRRKDSMSQGSGDDTDTHSTYQNLDQIVRNLNQVDGGGVLLFINPQQLIKIVESKSEYFNHIIESFVAGLLIYGSNLPIQKNIDNPDAIKNRTLEKLDRCCYHISQAFLLEQSDYQTFFFQDNLPQIAKNICFLMKKLQKMIKDENWQKLSRKCGNLMATHNGHNGSLTYEQFSVLQYYVQSSLKEIELKEQTKQY